ncbi:MAG: ROK family protein [Caldivirga sp.]
MRGVSPWGSRQGFLESEVSGLALFKRTRRYYMRIRDEGCLRALSQCSPGDAECVFKAFDNGVSAIGVVLRREASIIGVVVANIISILNPEVVVLGGLGVEVGRRFMDVVITTASRVAQPYSLRGCRITVSKLGYLSNIYGAAKLVIDTHGS